MSEELQEDQNHEDPRRTEVPAGIGQKRSGLRVLIVGNDADTGQRPFANSLSKALNDEAIDAFTSTATIELIEDPRTLVEEFEKALPATEPNVIGIGYVNGSLSHPIYGPEVLAALYGAQPDFVVMCFAPFRATLRDTELQGPTVAAEIANVMLHARRFNPNAQMLAIMVDNEGLTEANVDDAKNSVYGIGMQFDAPIFSMSELGEGTGFKSVVDRLAKIANKEKTRG